MVAAPYVKSFYEGVPLLGKDEAEIIEHPFELDLIRNYKKIQTIGCGAGETTAALLANRLNAELVVSIDARFYKCDLKKR